MDRETGLVSVIIPTYNRAALCKRAVESVLAQTYSRVEAIVVDDGSTDDTRKVISGIDERVKYIWQENAGISAARNLGLLRSNGEYIAFLDSDDAWFEWKLEVQLSTFRAFPAVGMVWTDMIAEDAHGREIRKSYLKEMYDAYRYFDAESCFQASTAVSRIWDECPGEYADRKCYVGNIFSYMFLGNLVHTSTVVLRRERMEKVGRFDTELQKSGEDYDFHFRTCRFGNVAYLDVPSIRYRVGAPDQLTSREFMIWVARNNLRTISKMYAVAREEISLPPSLIRDRWASSYAWVGVEELLSNPKNARAHLLKSLRLDPFQLQIVLRWLLSFLPEKILSLLARIKKLLPTHR